MNKTTKVFEKFIVASYPWRTITTGYLASLLTVSAFVAPVQAAMFCATVKGSKGPCHDGIWTYDVEVVQGTPHKVKFTVTKTPGEISEDCRINNDEYINDMYIYNATESNGKYTFMGTNNGLMMSGMFTPGTNTLMIDTPVKTDSARVAYEVSNVSYKEPPKEKDSKDPKAGQTQPTGKMNYDGGTKKLSFADIFLDNAVLTNGNPSLNDPILGATVTVGDSLLFGEESGGTGWYFLDTTLKFDIGGVSVLTADLTDNFLFVGGGKMNPEFDSLFQGVLSNITINNVINSPYLDDLLAYTNAGGSSHFSMSGNILSATNNLTTSGNSVGIAWGQDGTKVPEPSSTLSLLALGTLGAASTLKRKLKPTKSAEKETTKVS